MKKSFRTFCAAASLCVPLIAFGGIDATDGIALEVNGAFAAHLLSAKGGYPELDAQRDGATGTSRRRTRQAVPLGVSFSNKISGALAAWLVTPTAAPPAVAVLRVAGGKAVDRLVLATPELIGLEIVNLGAQPQPVEFRLQVISQNVSVLGGGPKASIPVAEREPYTVKVIVDGKPVLPLGVLGVGTLRQSLGGSGKATDRKSASACNDFSMTFHQTDIGWLFEWYKSVVLTPGVAAPQPARRIDVELVGTGKRMPLASLTGVVIRSFDPLSDPAGVAVTAEFSCDQFALLADAFK